MRLQNEENVILRMYCVILKKNIINYIHISMLTYTLAGEAFLP